MQESQIYISEKVRNSSNVVIDPATDDTLILLRRMVKLLESSATVDIANRQRMVVENLNTFVQGTGGGLGVPATNAPTASAPIQASSVSYVPVWVGPVDQRYQIIDQARSAYAMGIRSNLIFS